MKVQKTLAWIGIGLFLISCVDEIPLDISKGFRDNIVIQAKLVKGNPHRVEVRLSQLFDFTVQSRSTVRGKSALIRNRNEQTLPLKFRADGFYALDIPANSSAFEINDYDEFQIEVVDNFNRVFQSTFEPLMPNPGIDSLESNLISTLIQNSSNGEIRTFNAVSHHINVPTALPGRTDEKARLIWMLEPTYQLTDRPTNLSLLPYPNCFGGDVLPNKTCWIDRSSSLYNPVLFDNNTRTVDKLRIHLIDDPVNFYFAEGYYFNLFQESLSKGAFQYWTEIDKSVVREGDLLEPTPGEIVTNFECLCEEEVSVYGYFYATEVDTLRKYISPEFAGNPDSLCYWFGYDLNLDVECACQNCLNENKSDTIKPPYWEY